MDKTTNHQKCIWTDCSDETRNLYLLNNNNIRRVQKGETPLHGTQAHHICERCHSHWWSHWVYLIKHEGLA